MNDLFSALMGMRLMSNTEDVEIVRTDLHIGGDTIISGGKRVRRAERRFPAKIVVYPASGKDLALLPEGDRLTETLSIFQRKQGETQLVHGDRFVWQQKVYFVKNVSTWGPYIQALAQVVDVGPDRVQS